MTNADMRPQDVIAAKRDGRQLTKDQIHWFVQAYASGTGVADEQAAALAMAIYLNGMTGSELADWTGAMIDSGRRLDLSSVARPTVDKHSTGGVGDKVSLILVPLVAACGAAVPQLSGRGLGHTGGTLDKLESIPGWSPNVSESALLRQLDAVGGVIAGASADLVPADRKLYALRDVTATVDSIPLIASSIMSKKIAEGTDALVLDVKVGSGAFMTTMEDAELLSRTMVDLGHQHGVRTTALVTAMDRVLGRTVGNALEVGEAIEVLSGGGPPDLITLTVTLAREMVRLAGLSDDPAELLRSGAALEVFRELVAAQGGDPTAPLPRAKHRLILEAPSSGRLIGIEARAAGEAAWRLGAGRTRKEDVVSATAGIVCLAGVGDEVQQGQPLLELHADDSARFAAAAAGLRGAIRISLQEQVRQAGIIKLIVDRDGSRAP